MYLGVILNRVFRIKYNPLFDYIAEHQDEINKVYFILPIEDLFDAAAVKRDYYYKVVKGFVSTLDKYNLHPYIVTYEKLGELVDTLALSHVLVAKYIMSYHKETYNYPHVKKLLKSIKS